jgi:hypothetical protein
VLDYFLVRVERLDKSINSVVTLDAAQARHEADVADAALVRGEITGPLPGVPMTIKDSFQTAGMRTTSGAPEFARFIPEEDAWPVARLREAGAIIFGKTNLPIYAADLQSYNEVFGTTKNPYDLSRTPGGSAGGSAAAFETRCYLPEARPGLLPGYRVHGPYDPKRGLRFNPNKLLLDPYAKHIDGGIKWSDALCQQAAQLFRLPGGSAITGARGRTVFVAPPICTP